MRLASTTQKSGDAMTIEFYKRFGPELDLGTPKVNADTSVNLKIDGAEIQVPEGTSVMRAAGIAGIQIPKLCASEDLEAFGSCRLLSLIHI